MFHHIHVTMTSLHKEIQGSSFNTELISFSSHLCAWVFSCFVPSINVLAPLPFFFICFLCYFLWLKQIHLLSVTTVTLLFFKLNHLFTWSNQIGKTCETYVSTITGDLRTAWSTAQRDWKNLKSYKQWKRNLIDRRLCRQTTRLTEMRNY